MCTTANRARVAPLMQVGVAQEMVAKQQRSRSMSEEDEFQEGVEIVGEMPGPNAGLCGSLPCPTCKGICYLPGSHEPDDHLCQRGHRWAIKGAAGTFVAGGGPVQVTEWKEEE